MNMSAPVIRPTTVVVKVQADIDALRQQLGQVHTDLEDQLDDVKGRLGDGESLGSQLANVQDRLDVLVDATDGLEPTLEHVNGQLESMTVQVADIHGKIVPQGAPFVGQPFHYDGYGFSIFIHDPSTRTVAKETGLANRENLLDEKKLRSCLSKLDELSVKHKADRARVERFATGLKAFFEVYGEQGARESSAVTSTPKPRQGTTATIKDPADQTGKPTGPAKTNPAGKGAKG
jgi:hypothetical protein